MNLELNTEPKNWNYSALWILVAALIVSFTTTVWPLAHEIGGEGQLSAIQFTVPLFIAGVGVVIAVVNLYTDNIPSERTLMSLYLLAFVIISVYLMVGVAFLKELGYISDVALRVLGFLLTLAVTVAGVVSISILLIDIFGKIRYQGSWP